MRDFDEFVMQEAMRAFNDVRGEFPDIRAGVEIYATGSDRAAAFVTLRAYFSQKHLSLMMAFDEYNSRDWAIAIFGEKTEEFRKGVREYLKAEKDGES